MGGRGMGNGGGMGNDNGRGLADGGGRGEGSFELGSLMPFGRVVEHTPEGDVVKYVVMTDVLSCFDDIRFALGEACESGCDDPGVRAFAEDTDALCEDADEFCLRIGLGCTPTAEVYRRFERAFRERFGADVCRPDEADEFLRSWLAELGRTPGRYAGALLEAYESVEGDEEDQGDESEE